MFVAASTRCFANLPLEEALARLSDLEFSYIELMIHEHDGHIRPSDVLNNPDETIARCRKTQRLTPIAFSVEIDAPEPLYYEQFAACCRLAKAIRVVVLTVRSSPIGTPYNAEVERLERMVKIATLEGVRLCLLTEQGRICHDPSTIASLCEHIKGLGITFDPSHYVFATDREVKYEKIMPYVCHVRLRDTKKDKFQVRVGQGEIDYGKLITMLRKHNYDRALCVDIEPMPGVDQNGELRKFRLLLESML